MAVWAAIIGAAVTVATTAYSAYASDQAQSQQYAYAKRNADLARQQEEAAGQARVNQIEYEANKRKKMFASSAAAAGVDVGSGSLLESIGRFGADAEYSKQLARFPHQLAGQSDQYKSDLFNFQSKLYARNAGVDAAMAGVREGSTLATRYSGNFFGVGVSPSNVQAP